MFGNNNNPYKPAGFPKLGLKPMPSMEPKLGPMPNLPRAVANPNPVAIRPDYYAQQRQELHNPFQKIQALFGRREDDMSKPRK